MKKPIQMDLFDPFELVFLFRCAAPFDLGCRFCRYRAADRKYFGALHLLTWVVGFDRYRAADRNYFGALHL